MGRPSPRPDRRLARARLVAQHLAGPQFATAEEAVAAFGLMQGQEPTVFSSVALRTVGGLDSVLAALDRGTLARGYTMRGTVFLTLASEQRWLTELLAKPGVERARARCAEAGVGPAQLDEIRVRALDAAPLDNAAFRRIVVEVAPGAASSAAYRTRYALLVDATLSYLGRSQLLHPAPATPGLRERFNGDRQAAATEVIRRYVATHGPVTEADVRWWSKLPAAEVRAGLAGLGEGFARSGEYFQREGLEDELAALPASALRRPLLLPAFDEYILGYADRHFAMSPATHAHLAPSNMGVFRKAIVVDGVVRGTWRGAAGRLAVEDVAGVPKYAEPGIRAAFARFPFFPPATVGTT